jgi:hypothetical protein
MFNRNIEARFTVRQSLTRRSRSIAISGLLATIALTIYAPAPAQAIWCANYNSGARNCGFSTQAQCLVTVSGVGGFCSVTSDAQSTSSSGPKRTRKATTEPESKPAAKKTQAVREQPTPATPVTTPAAKPTPTPSPAAAAVAAQAAANAARDFASARQLILSGQFEAGGAAMRALNLDNEPNVAAYIGLAQRKLGRIDEAKSWYERALTADPNHKLTLSFYGMLRAEQGDLSGAQAYLNRIGKLCGGTECNEYRALQGVISSKNR